VPDLEEPSVSFFSVSIGVEHTHSTCLVAHPRLSGLLTTRRKMGDKE
jgi:hypothetical protein